MTTILRSCTKTRPCTKDICERNCRTRTYDCVDNQCIPNDDGTGMLLSECRENCVLKQDNNWVTIYIILGTICGVIFILLVVLIIYYFFFARQIRK